MISQASHSDHGMLFVSLETVSLTDRNPQELFSNASMPKPLTVIASLATRSAASCRHQSAASRTPGTPVLGPYPRRTSQPKSRKQHKRHPQPERKPVGYSSARVRFPGLSSLAGTSRKAKSLICIRSMFALVKFPCCSYSAIRSASCSKASRKSRGSGVKGISIPSFDSG